MGNSRIIKLYKVNLNHNKFSGDIDYSTIYVFSTDSAKAYEIAVDYLKGQDVGTDASRSMRSVELIAEASDYPGCGRICLVG